MIFVDTEKELAAIFTELSFENQAKLLIKARQSRRDEKRGKNRGEPSVMPDCNPPGIKEAQTR
jgi:hypothetical protein